MFLCIFFLVEDTTLSELTQLIVAFSLVGLGCIGLPVQRCGQETKAHCARGLGDEK